MCYSRHTVMTAEAHSPGDLGKVARAGASQRLLLPVLYFLSPLLLSPLLSPGRVRVATSQAGNREVSQLGKYLWKA